MTFARMCDKATPDYVKSIIIFICLLSVMPVSVAMATEVHPFRVVDQLKDGQGLNLLVDATQYQQLANISGKIQILLPITMNWDLTLELERFSVVAPDARFYKGSPSGDIEIPRPEVVTLRGTVQGETNSHAYLSLTKAGCVNGYVTTESGGTYFVSQIPGDPYAVVNPATGLGELPPWVEFCGVEDLVAGKAPDQEHSLGATDSPAGARLANIAFDCDQDFYNIFGDITDAEAYSIQLLGAVSDIYQRDMNVRLQLTFFRIWPTGGEPYSSYDLSSFTNWWMANEDLTGLDLVHHLSGKRDLPFGGVAWVNAVCNSAAGFAISGYLNGSFPTPVGTPNNGNWDIVVMAHEMGHNFGSYHTHDGGAYSPVIDDCGNGTPSLGTILSYCHIWPGYTSNISMRFHARVQQVIQDRVVLLDCLGFDCNGNGVDDAIDIANATSPDVNTNGIPDECEDCNGNLVFDGDDIGTVSFDVNGNGIPDECEPDCDGNGVPDEYQVTLPIYDDVNGNNIPDICAPDCNGNGRADHVDIATGSSFDYDRNTIPDECQDCDGNSVPDWIDLERQYNLFVADQVGGVVREYHQVSGYPIRNYGLGVLSQPYDVAFGTDDLLFVASYGNDKVVAINVVFDLVLGQIGPLAELGSPSAIAVGDDGDLYVASFNNSSIVRLSYASGLFTLEETFVAAGSNGLSNPMGLAFGPNGNLFVSSSTNEVFEFSGADGSYVQTFVSAGDGGLNGPRGLTFYAAGNLLVNSYATSRVLEYDGATGAFVREFNDANNIDNPWGIEIGPNENVFVGRTQDQNYQIYEYIPDAGRYYRSFVRRDYDLVLPSGFAFKPGSAGDCDADFIPDVCEAAGNIDCCCKGARGNANGDGNDDVNISDVSFLVEFLFGVPLGPEPTCFEEGNVNGDSGGNINISDITYLVDYLFGVPLGPEPPICQ